MAAQQQQREAFRGRNPNDPLPLEPTVLTDEEEYNWDVAGYLLVPGVLSPEEVLEAAACADDGDFEPLIGEGSALLPTLSRLCCSADSMYDFGGIRVDIPPRELLPPELGAPSPPLEGGGTGAVGRVDHSRSYFNTGGHRFVHGVRVIWCLGSGQSGYTVIPGSHKSTAETPAAVRTGDADDALESLGLLQQPPLRPGDVLVIAASALHGLCSTTDTAEGPARLVACDFSSNRARTADALSHPTPPALGSAEPGWTAALSPVQRVVLGLDPPAVVRSNGNDHAWIDPDAVREQSFVCNGLWESNDLPRQARDKCKGKETKKEGAAFRRTR